MKQFIHIHHKGKDRYFKNEDELLRHFLGCENVSANYYQYDLNDEYITRCDIGYPFEYWKEGTKFTLREWVKQVEKECPITAKGMRDIEIIGSIIHASYKYQKVSK